ncbi:MAG: hypothetical protein GC164_06955 [Phycisphaera sp.]|nr:hypothetical protein [Phycisphaera sp.]
MGHRAIRFTHLVNPFVAKPGSEHDLAQRITWAGLRRAIEQAEADGIEVELLGVCYPHDVASVERPARALPVLVRTIQDVKKIEPVRPFPVVMDLFRAAREHGQGDYLVFSNMDIVPQPCYYRCLAAAVRSGVQAISVARKTIPKEHHGQPWQPGDLDTLFNTPGKLHWGHDTFVFPMDWVDRLELGEMCYCVAAFDRAICANLDALCGYRAVHYQFQHLSFHLGDDRAWAAMDQYTEYNKPLCLALIDRLEAHYGKAPWPSLTQLMKDRLAGHPRFEPNPRFTHRIARKVHHLYHLPPERRMAKLVMQARRDLGLRSEGFA